MGRHTITGMLTASGQQFMDWSSAYRLFSRQRVDTSKLFEVACSGTLQELEQQPWIVGHMDDTILKKTGLHIPGTAWRRDPLGPPFQTNFIWGQRFLQISLALPDHPGCSQSRAIPIDFHHCPTAKKPSKKAAEQDWNQYKENKQKLKLSKQGHERLHELRKTLDKQGAGNKQLIVSVDGSYTNKEVLKHLPERVTLIGRIRKDTKLYALPAFITAVYALLHLAAHKSQKVSNMQLLPRPKWYQNKNGKRHTTGDLINNMKAQAWAKAIGLNFSSFVNYELKKQNQRNSSEPCKSAMFYMRN